MRMSLPCNIARAVAPRCSLGGARRCGLRTSSVPCAVRDVLNEGATLMRYVLFWVLLLLGVVPVLAGPTTNLRGTTDTWLTINAQVLGGAAFPPPATPVTLTSTGYQFAECEFQATSWGGTRTAQAAM